jgi:hypothetical protein
MGSSPGGGAARPPGIATGAGESSGTTPAGVSSTTVGGPEQPNRTKHNGTRRTFKSARLDFATLIGRSRLVRGVIPSVPLVLMLIGVTFITRRYRIASLSH